MSEDKTEPVEDLEVAEEEGDDVKGGFHVAHNRLGGDIKMETLKH